jgi:hypothetical protein
MKDTLDDRYVRADDYASRVDSLEFSNQVWSVFGQFSQPRSGTEIASALRLAPEAVQTALRRLVDSKLIRKQAPGAASAAKVAPPAKTASAPSPAKPAAKAAPASAPAPAAAPAAAGKRVVTIAPAAAPATAPVVSLRLSSERALKAPKAPLVNLKLGGPAAAPEPCAPWKLRPILDAIGAHAGGGVAGQLLVYKVFLQLPPDILKAAGLESLSVVDDHFTVTHPSLRPALVEAARRHANFDITPLLAA